MSWTDPVTRYLTIVVGSCFALATTTVANALVQQGSGPFYGLGRAKDGDSLMVGRREVRLFGIDAPEFDQTCKRAAGSWPCGAEAATRLSELVTGKDIRCVEVSTDQYDRAVSRCTVGTTDINSAMVESGLATAYRLYSTDYVTAEAHAKAAGRGLWSGTFETPVDYRAEHRYSKAKRSGRPAQPLAADARCNIKGNRNRRGQWIYHLPGMPYYEQTRPEQMFCTEAQAQAAGYRRAIIRN